MLKRSIPHLFFIPLLMATVGCSAHTATPTVASKLSSVGPDQMQIIKGSLDNRDYTYFELENGLKCLAISDPDVEIAAASLGIQIGQFSDPQDRMGLAHFLEHMLFMGTDKYPDVDDYRKFIQGHGGGSNAGTGQETTVYHFTVDQAFLEPSLDRFSRFFVAPILNPEYVDRERNAVNSEYSLKIKTDARRIREVMRKTTNPAHPFSKFSVGNLETLADREDQPVYEDLRTFYDEHYSASKMTMAVLGSQSTADLQTMVERMFSPVPSDGTQAAPSEVVPHLPEQIGVQINITPLSERRTIQLQFPVEPTTELFPKKPISYISGVLGHEGEGSLFSHLKKQGLVERLSVSSSGAEDYEMITVDISLSEAGYAQRDAVVGTVFQAIQLLKTEGVVERRFDERKSISATNFRFKETSTPVSAVRGGVYALSHFPPENALNYGYVMGDFDDTLIKAYLDKMTPQNLRLVVVGPDLGTDQIEPLYDVPYSIRPLTEEQTSLWSNTEVNEALSVPAPNQFIADDFELRPQAGDAATEPSLIVDTPTLTVWHQMDTSFEVPRATIFAEFFSTNSKGGARESALNQLYATLVNDSLTEFNYPLSQAGLHAGFSSSQHGLRLYVSGYNDKQVVLVDQLAERLQTFVLNEDRFEAEKARMLREWRNAKTERPISQSYWALGELVNPARFSFEERERALSTIGVADLNAFIDTYFDHSSIELFVHGNHTDADAKLMGNTLVAKLLKEGDVSVRGVVQTHLIPKGNRLIRQIEVDHNDSTLIQIHQSDDPSVLSEAKYKMLGKLLETPFFTELRTKQQLGYMVRASASSFDQLPAISMAIQSANTDPVQLEKKVSQFLIDNFEVIKAMDVEEFTTLRAGLITKLEEPELRLSQRSSRLSQALMRGSEFNRKALLAEAVSQITLEQMIEFYQTVLLADDARKLIVRSVGTGHSIDASDVSECISADCVEERFSETFSRDR